MINWNSIDLSKDEYISFLRSWIADTCGEWDYDDYTSVKVSDPQIESIRQRLIRLSDKYPPRHKHELYNRDEGDQEVLVMIKELEKAKKAKVGSSDA